jgi:hypothetical protein
MVLIVKHGALLEKQLADALLNKIGESAQNAGMYFMDQTLRHTTSEAPHF